MSTNSEKPLLLWFVSLGIGAILTGIANSPIMIVLMFMAVPGLVVLAGVQFFCLQLWLTPSFLMWGPTRSRQILSMLFLASVPVVWIAVPKFVQLAASREVATRQRHDVANSPPLKPRVISLLDPSETGNQRPTLCTSTCLRLLYNREIDEVIVGDASYRVERRSACPDVDLSGRHFLIDWKDRSAILARLAVGECLIAEANTRSHPDVSVKVERTVEAGYGLHSSAVVVRFYRRIELADAKGMVFYRHTEVDLQRLSSIFFFVVSALGNRKDELVGAFDLNEVLRNQFSFRLQPIEPISLDAARDRLNAFLDSPDQPGSQAILSVFGSYIDGATTMLATAPLSREIDYALMQRMIVDQRTPMMGNLSRLVPLAPVPEQVGIAGALLKRLQALPASSEDGNLLTTMVAVGALPLNAFSGHASELLKTWEKFKSNKYAFHLLDKIAALGALAAPILMANLQAPFHKYFGFNRSAYFGLCLLGSPAGDASIPLLLRILREDVTVSNGMRLPNNSASMVLVRMNQQEQVKQILEADNRNTEMLRSQVAALASKSPEQYCEWHR